RKSTGLSREDRSAKNAQERLVRRQLQKPARLRRRPLLQLYKNKKNYSTRWTYLASEVSTRILSPSLTKGGTGTTSPVSSVAGFITELAVAFWMVGSVCVTRKSMVSGRLMPMAFSSWNSTFTMVFGTR